MNFKLVVTLFSAGLALGSIAHAQDSASAPSPAATTKDASEYNANDSGKNKRDAKSDELTAQDQSSSKADVEITRKIRRAITSDSKLSMSAHNIKIIVADKSITLKGPVKTAKEKKVLEAKAHAVAPQLEITNQLEVIQ